MRMRINPIQNWGTAKPATEDDCQGVVCFAAAAERANHAQRYGDDDADHDRRGRELERVREPVEDVAHDRAPIDHGVAEVTVQDTPIQVRYQT